MVHARTSKMSVLETQVKFATVNIQFQIEEAATADPAHVVNNYDAACISGFGGLTVSCQEGVTSHHHPFAKSLLFYLQSSNLHVDCYSLHFPASRCSVQAVGQTWTDKTVHSQLTRSNTLIPSVTSAEST